MMGPFRLIQSDLCRDVVFVVLWGGIEGLPTSVAWGLPSCHIPQYHIISGVSPGSMTALSRQTHLKSLATIQIKDIQDSMRYVICLRRVTVRDQESSTVPPNA